MKLAAPFFALLSCTAQIVVANNTSASIIGSSDDIDDIGSSSSSSSTSNLRGRRRSSEPQAKDKLQIIASSDPDPLVLFAKNMLSKQGCSPNSSYGDQCYTLTETAASDLQAVLDGTSNQPAHQWHDPTSFWKAGVCNAKNLCVELFTSSQIFGTPSAVSSPSASAASLITESADDLVNVDNSSSSSSDPQDIDASTTVEPSQEQPNTVPIESSDKSSPKIRITKKSSSNPLQSFAINMLENQGCPSTSSCGDPCYVLTTAAASGLHSVVTGVSNQPTHHWHDPTSFWSAGICNVKSQCVSVNPFDHDHYFDDLARTLTDVEKGCGRNVGMATIFVLAKAMEPPTRLVRKDSDL